VLQWNSAFDGPWSAESVRKYREGGFDGLVLSPSADWAPSDLDFLAELTGLRLFSLRSKLRRDLAAFHIDTLEDLTLVTGSRLPVPNAVQPELRRLCVTDRPGLEIDPRWPMLEWFRLGTWRGTDCQILSGAERLATVHIEGRRQSGTLEGIEECQSLENLTTINYSIGDTAPLRALNNLVEVKLLAAHPTPSHGRVDVSDVAGGSLSKLWIANAPALSGIESLSENPMLREVRLIDCGLAESDQRVLDALPKWVEVRIVTTRKK
jgi:hypothetical protein